MTDPYNVYNYLNEIMCGKCDPTQFRECKDQIEDARCRNMIRCMKLLIEIKYLQYPDSIIKKREMISA